MYFCVCIDSKDVELSQSLDATASLDIIADTVPQSQPVDDNDFNLYLSNATTVTQSSAASQQLEEVSSKYLSFNHACIYIVIVLCITKYVYQCIP